MGKRAGGLGMGMDAILDKGGGVSALFGGSSAVNQVEAQGASSISEIPIDEIERNPDQPRKDFDPEQLMDLCNSIKSMGLITPITLRKLEEHRYQIVAGERRFRASKMAGKDSITAYVIENMTDEKMQKMALVENIQRTDLNAIEVALSYKNLIERYNLTQEQLSEEVGKNRSTVSNYVRLLGLPAEIQKGLQEHKIENGHARALLAIENPEKQQEVYKQIVDKGLSVRKVEELARLIKQQENAEQTSTEDAPTQDSSLPEEFNQLAARLENTFNTKVDISKNKKGKGKITISFDDDSALERIMEVLDSLPSQEE